MKELHGFDETAALAMVQAYGRPASPAVIERLRNSDFWGLYDPEPVGAVAITFDSQYSPGMHVGCIHRGRAGHAVRRVVEAALQRYGQLYAEIRNDCETAIRLAIGLGFEPIGRTDTHLVCWREA